ncbi:MAG TPA: hypothetical protein VFE24_16965 [Pirellulales bacterium]|jgi:hypothetical protein|nr:hypothetical protein [Pirellulales bacterium]
MTELNQELQPQTAILDLAGLPYQLALVEFLKRLDPDVWDWIAKSATGAKAAEEVKFELLKSTYRVERELQPAIYEAAEEVAARCGIVAPVTIYQAQNPQGLNAGLAYVLGEIHLILQGPIASQLTPVEIRALLGHELAHYRLWYASNGEFRIAADMLHALANDSHAHPAHFASIRLLRLYDEIYCDRGAWAVTGDVLSVVSMLVKVNTGLPEVSAASYLRQAEEIFSKGQPVTSERTHPEVYIRARAIKLWADLGESANERITQMIEGAADLQELDLLAQEKLATATRRVLDALLCRKWFQTDPVLAHARLFFADYIPPEALLVDAELSSQVPVESKSLQDYFGFLLLDFVAADRDLEEAPVAAALSVAEPLGIKPQFLELLRKELKIRKTQLEKIDREQKKILADADRAGGAP